MAVTLEELVQNEEFMRQCREADSIDAVAKLFSNQGIAVTEEELEKLMVPDDELSEEDLENVAGGIKKLTPDPVQVIIKAVLKLIGKSAKSSSGSSGGGHSSGGGRNG